MMQDQTTVPQFEDRFAPQDQQNWRFVADGVMGGLSQGTLAFHSSSSGHFARMTGQVTTENNGGFIQFRRMLPGSLSHAVTSLNLRVRGNDEGYFVFLKTQYMTRPWHSFRAAFSVSPSWSDVTLPLTGFERSHDILPETLDASTITSIGIVAYGRDHLADISVAAVAFS